MTWQGGCHKLIPRWSLKLQFGENAMGKYLVVGATFLALSAVLDTTAFAGDRSGLCTLKETSDGFVALRYGPSTKYKINVKLGSWIQVEPRGHVGKWEKVMAFTDNFGNVPGYVHRSLIDWKSCE
jgi:hypothetical protein